MMVMMAMMMPIISSREVSKEPLELIDDMINDDDDQYNYQNYDSDDDDIDDWSDGDYNDDNHQFRRQVEGKQQL